jgi:hypothetical protein
MNTNLEASPDARHAGIGIRRQDEGYIAMTDLMMFVRMFLKNPAMRARSGRVQTASVPA